MKKITLIFLMILTSTILVKAQRLIYSSNYPTQKVRVVLEQSQGGTIVESIKNLEYLPLQAGKEDLIDYIVDFKIVEDRIAIVGSPSSGGLLYIYDNNGKLIKKVSKIQDVLKTRDNGLFYKIDKDGGNLKLTGMNTVSQYLFTKNGDYVDTIKNNFQGGIPAKELNLNANSKFSYTSIFYWNGRKDNNVLSLNDSILIKFNPLDTNMTYYTMSDGFTKVNEDLAYLSIAQKNQIYELDSKGVKNIYDFVFPMNNTLAEEDKLKFKNVNDLINYLTDQSSKIIEIGRVVRFKNYLIFSIILGTGPNWLALDLENKSIYNLSNIIADKSNDYLDFLGPSYLTTDGEYLYSIIYPQDIRSAINKSATEKHTIRKTYLDLQKSNNPVIVKFQLNL